MNAFPCKTNSAGHGAGEEESYIFTTGGENEARGESPGRRGMARVREVARRGAVVRRVEVELKLVTDVGRDGVGLKGEAILSHVDRDVLGCGQRKHGEGGEQRRGDHGA